MNAYANTPEPEDRQGAPASATALWAETRRLARLWWEELQRVVAIVERRLTTGAPTGGSRGAWRVTPRGGRLYRSRRDRMVRGVCAGLAQAFDLPVPVVRLAFIVLFFTGVLHAVIPYVLLAVLLPEDPREDGAER